MECRGIPPSDVTLNCFIMLLYRRSGTRSAKIVCRFMANDVKPSLRTFQTVIKAFEHERDVDKAMEWRRKAALVYPAEFRTDA